MSDYESIWDKDVLPDSRLRTPHTPKRSVLYHGTFHEPVYCANCGKEGGLVPEEGMTFAFWLCNPCFDRMGHITATMAVPDDVFFAKLRAEQIERFGHVLTDAQLQQVVAEGASPIATLIHERRAA